MFFLEFPFSMIQQMLAIWSLVSLPFLNAPWTSGSSRFTYCWSLAWRILSISMWDECNCAVVWIFFGIAFLRDWNEHWPFPVLWPKWTKLNKVFYFGTFHRKCIVNIQKGENEGSALPTDVNRETTVPEHCTGRTTIPWEVGRTPHPGCQRGNRKETSEIIWKN